MRVLFVCTANVCRSPLASALFARAARIHRVPTAVSASAGFLEEGHEVHEHVVRLLDERGVDVSRMTSRKLTVELITPADLILTMTSAHARGVVSRVPATISNVYAFRHFGAIVTPRPADMSTDDWLESINRANPRSYLDDDDLLDVPDPIGRSFDEFGKLAAEFESTIDWIMTCAYPSKEARSA